MKTKKAFVILGDMVDSRSISNRNSFSKKLEGVLSNVNKKFNKDLLAPFERLKGVDEIGAVVKSFTHGYEIIQLLHNGLLPKKIRISVCYGEIDTGLENRRTSLMDGRAFHLASDSLQQLKSSPYIFKLQTGNDTDGIITGLANYLLSDEQKWTSRQQKIASLYHECRQQFMVAKKLHISQQAVSQALKSINWYAHEQSETNIKDFIKTHYI